MFIERGRHQLPKGASFLSIKVSSSYMYVISTQKLLEDAGGHFHDLSWWHIIFVQVAAAGNFPMQQLANNYAPFITNVIMERIRSTGTFFSMAKNHNHNYLLKNLIHLKIIRHELVS